MTKPAHTEMAEPVHTPLDALKYVTRCLRLAELDDDTAVNTLTGIAHAALLQHVSPSDVDVYSDGRKTHITRTMDDGTVVTFLHAPWSGWTGQDWLARFADLNDADFRAAVTAQGEMIPIELDALLSEIGTATAGLSGEVTPTNNPYRR